MQEDRKFDRNVDFVARNYRSGAFDYKNGLDRLGLRGRSRWHVRVAAVVAGVTVLAASAIGVWHVVSPSYAEHVDVAAETSSSVAAGERTVRIEFSDTPLADVVKEIETAYGVTISDIPEDDYKLTLSYEGTAVELVAVINELLGTEMKVVL